MDRIFTRIANRCAQIMGQPAAFVISVLLIVLWAISGPMLHYSDTWQLIVNPATTVLTFLVVFLIQNSQNRDAAAMQAKLDELLRAVDKAREQFIGIEHLTDQQIELVRTALERHAKELKEKQQNGKQSTKQKSAEDTVDRLLDRF